MNEAEFRGIAVRSYGPLDGFRTVPLAINLLRYFQHFGLKEAYQADLSPPKCSLFPRDMKPATARQYLYRLVERGLQVDDMVFTVERGPRRTGRLYEKTVKIVMRRGRLEDLVRPPPEPADDGFRPVQSEDDFVESHDDFVPSTLLDAEGQSRDSEEPASDSFVPYYLRGRQPEAVAPSERAPARPRGHPDPASHEHVPITQADMKRVAKLVFDQMIDKEAMTHARALLDVDRALPQYEPSEDPAREAELAEAARRRRELEADERIAGIVHEIVGVRIRHALDDALRPVLEQLRHLEQVADQDALARVREAADRARRDAAVADFRRLHQAGSPFGPAGPEAPELKEML